MLYNFTLKASQLVLLHPGWLSREPVLYNFTLKASQLVLLHPGWLSREPVLYNFTLKASQFYCTQGDWVMSHWFKFLDKSSSVCPSLWLLKLFWNLLSLLQFNKTWSYWGFLDNSIKHMWGVLGESGGSRTT